MFIKLRKENKDLNTLKEWFNGILIKLWSWCAQKVLSQKDSVRFKSVIQNQTMMMMLYLNDDGTALFAERSTTKRSGDRISMAKNDKLMLRMPWEGS